jgi:hypothetical protein
MSKSMMFLRKQPKVEKLKQAIPPMHNNQLATDAPPRPFGDRGINTEADEHRQGIGPKVEYIIPDPIGSVE